MKDNSNLERMIDPKINRMERMSPKRPPTQRPERAQSDAKNDKNIKDSNR